jgi:hypothetical protein
MNALAGPGCICYLRTALQTFHLPQVKRWKKAQTLVKELTARIVATQGIGTPTPGGTKEPTPLEGAG